MRFRMMMAAVFGLAVVAVAGVTAPGPASAADPGGVGMCSGRTDPNLGITAHVNGARGETTKFILNVSTDATGLATGSLILDRGPDHIVVTDFCRVWQHTAATVSKCDEPYPEGAITAHAVGLTTERDGTPLLVRADVRKTAEGDLFRVRYRVLTGEDRASPAAMGEEGGCEDEGWTWIPAEEEWGPLDQLMVRTAG